MMRQSCGVLLRRSGGSKLFIGQNDSARRGRPDQSGEPAKRNAPARPRMHGRIGATYLICKSGPGRPDVRYDLHDTMQCILHTALSMPFALISKLCISHE